MCCQSGNGPLDFTQRRQADTASLGTAVRPCSMRLSREFLLLIAIPLLILFSTWGGLRQDGSESNEGESRGGVSAPAPLGPLVPAAGAADPRAKIAVPRDLEGRSGSPPAAESAKAAELPKTPVGANSEAGMGEVLSQERSTPSDSGAGERIVVERRVVDRHGVPVEGARVLVRERSNAFDSRFRPFSDRVWQEPLVTDSGGGFAVPARPGFIYEVQVHAEGYAPSTLRLFGQAPAPVVLYPPSLVRGRATDGLSGAPLSMVEVTLESGSFVRRVLTDGAGRFEIGGVSAGTHLLSLRHPGFTLARATFLVAGTGDVVQRDFVLQPGVTVSGKVRLRSGGTSPFTLVRIFDLEKQLLVASGLTNQDGHYEFASLSERGLFEVSADAGSVGMGLANFEIEIGIEELAVDLVVEDLWALTGIVTNEESAPLAGATITVARASGSWNGFIHVDADEEGRFVVEGLAAGQTYLVVARCEGFAMMTRLGVTRELASEPLIFALPEEAALRGLVVSNGSTPVPGALVRVTMPGTGTSPLYGYSDDLGRFDLRGLATGLVQVTVLAPRHLPYQVEFSLALPAVVEMGTLTLTPSVRTAR